MYIYLYLSLYICICFISIDMYIRFVHIIYIMFMYICILHIYLSLSFFPSFSLSLYIYIYLSLYIYIHIHMYIYLFILCIYLVIYWLVTIIFREVSFHCGPPNMQYTMKIEENKKKLEQQLTTLRGHDSVTLVPPNGYSGRLMIVVFIVGVGIGFSIRRRH